MPPKLKPLAEQVIVVTGATSGNGLAIVEQAARAGAAVVAVARNVAALDALKSRLSAGGARIAVCAADVSDIAAVERVADAALRRLVASTAGSTTPGSAPTAHWSKCRSRTTAASST